MVSRNQVVGYFTLNVLSSVSIVFVNKIVLNDWSFPTVLPFIHFWFGWLGVLISQKLKLFEPVSLPLKQVFVLCIAFCGWVLGNTASQAENSTAFYQLFKILGTPMTVIVNAILLRRKKQSYPLGVWISTVIVFIGIYIATISGKSFSSGISFNGFIYAMIGVSSNVCYSTYSKHIMTQHQVSSFQLFSYTAPISCILLFGVNIFAADLGHILSLTYTPMQLLGIVCSGIISFFVNLSIFMVVGAASPTAYAVVSNLKTVLIFIGAFVLFKDPITPKVFIGISVTIAAVVLYSYSDTRSKMKKIARPEKSEDLIKLNEEPEFEEESEENLKKNV
eukprot:TRINITY_DN2792_c0_g1_i2.p1 TRINITY_DN2792_c0_g1~~TRINITY_DN2792_c0_g1_i2.p1  ORF type:complete len:345 (+),score=74.00 TRINITY_DN2792_c0_g1_i2:36-1037(+)